jgi:hypothetical protein
MDEKSKKPVVGEEEPENRLYSFIVGGFIVIAIMIVFIFLFNH